MRKPNPLFACLFWMIVVLIFLYLLLEMAERDDRHEGWEPIGMSEPDEWSVPKELSEPSYVSVPNIQERAAERESTVI